MSPQNFQDFSLQYLKDKFQYFFYSSFIFFNDNVCLIICGGEVMVIQIFPFKLI